jgi:hypothetical protein
MQEKGDFFWKFRKIQTAALFWKPHGATPAFIRIGQASEARRYWITRPHVEGGQRRGNLPTPQAREEGRAEKKFKEKCARACICQKKAVILRRILCGGHENCLKTIGNNGKKL